MVNMFSYTVTNICAHFFTLQQIDSDEMLKCIIELVKLEKEWVPDSNKCRNSSLYIRPTMIATNVCNGSKSLICMHAQIRIIHTYITSYVRMYCSQSAIIFSVISQASLGIHKATKALFYIVLCPVGPYFRTGFNPVSLYCDPTFVRSWPGGIGATKLGA